MSGAASFLRAQDTAHLTASARGVSLRLPCHAASPSAYSPFSSSAGPPLSPRSRRVRQLRPTSSCWTSTAWVFPPCRQRFRRWPGARVSSRARICPIPSRGRPGARCSTAAVPSESTSGESYRSVSITRSLYPALRGRRLRHGARGPRDLPRPRRRDPVGLRPRALGADRHRAARGRAPGSPARASALPGGELRRPRAPGRAGAGGSHPDGSLAPSDLH